jgi:hypothetical protein
MLYSIHHQANDFVGKLRPVQKLAQLKVRVEVGFYEFFVCHSPQPLSKANVVALR